MPAFKLTIILFAASILLAGCSTIKGVGEDLKTVGNWISNGSEHVRESMKNNPPGSKTDRSELKTANMDDLPNRKTDFLIDME